MGYISSSLTTSNATAPSSSDTTLRINGVFRVRLPNTNIPANAHATFTFDNLYELNTLTAAVELPEVGSLTLKIPNQRATL